MQHTLLTSPITSAQKYAKKLIADYLDPAKNFTAQQASTIRVVQQLVIIPFTCVPYLNTYRLQVADKFPELHEYADLWPVTDMVRLHLKYSSGRAHALDKVVEQRTKHKRIK